jgi:antitoxin (DNA-binding transcriptional repressor) of toxin-antitoxin stability system
MIHGMASATIRDLRTRFPLLKALVARDGEVVVTDHGKPAFVLRPFVAPPKTRAIRVEYFERLKKRQPERLSARAARALDEAERGER